MNAPVIHQRAKNSYAERLAAIMPKVPEIRAIISTLYPGPIEVEIEEDPEIDGYRYMVFRVETRESLSVVAERQERWYRLMEELCGRDFGDIVFFDPMILE